MGEEVAAATVAVWIVAVVDIAMLGFGLLMIVSKKARFGFADWVDRRMERRGK